MPAIGRLAEALHLKKPTVFCLHSVERSDDPDRMNGEMSVTDAFLYELIDHARRRGFEFVSIEDCVERVRRKDFGPYLCLTFDDGYRDNYEVAFPVLRDRSVPAAIFLATALVDGTGPMWWHPLERALSERDGLASERGEAPSRNPDERRRAYEAWADRFRAADPDGQVRLLREIADRNPHFRACEAYGTALDWSMIAQMSASGLVTFGAHTVTHPLLARLPRDRLTEEVEGSRDRLAAMSGTRPAYFAYPFGQPHEVGPEAPRVVAESGFAAAFSTVAATLSERNTGDLFMLPRIMLTRRTQRLSAVDAYVSGLTEAIKAI